MEGLLGLFDESTRELLEAISEINEEQFNRIPFDGSWTAGQVAEHLLKSESNLLKVLGGNSIHSVRDPLEMETRIRSIFLDFDTKFLSPKPFIPSDIQKDKKIMYQALSGSRSKIREFILNLDLNRTFIDIPFPNLGLFTGLEWIYFLLYHTRRHIRQLRNINAYFSEVVNKVS